ncbi:MAG: hypothetical protein ABH891_00985, partial [Candidatus Omnitrophota bacterium]
KPDDPFLITLDDAHCILRDIFSSYEIDEPIFIGDNLKAISASLDFLSKNTADTNYQNKVWCLVRKERRLSRIRSDGRFENAPDTPQREGVIARRVAVDIPMLMLFRQEGLEEQGWRGYPFWWPVLFTPQNTPTVIFADETT